MYQLQQMRFGRALYTLPVIVIVLDDVMGVQVMHLMMFHGMLLAVSCLEATEKAV